MRYSRLGYWGAMAVGLTVVFGGMALVMTAMPAGVSWAKFLLLSAIILAGVIVVLLAYRSADEVILSEHKTAWFWGSMIMLSLLGPLAIGIVWRLLPMPLLIHAEAKLPLLHRLLPPAGIPMPNEKQLYFLEGIMFVVVAQLAAFVVVWTYLHFRRAKP